MTTVNFRTQSGENNSRRFEKNQGISVYGKCTGITGIYEPGTHVRINVTKNGQAFFFDETNTDIFGDYDFWFRTPNEDTNLNVNIISTYSISGQDNVNIPISVGNLIPKPLPNPLQEMSWLGILPVVFIGLVAYLSFKEFQ